MNKTTLTHTFAKGLRLFFTTSLLAALALSVASVPTAQAYICGNFPLYAASYNNHNIVKVDSGGNQTVFTTGGNLDEPQGLAFDNSGNLYVGNWYNNKVVKVDAGGNQSIFTTGGSIAGSIGLAFDSSGDLYVASLGNDNIVKVDSGGNQTVFTTGGNISEPRGLAFDSSGNLYVGSGNNNKVVKVDAGGNQSIFTTGGNLNGLGALAFLPWYTLTVNTAGTGTGTVTSSPTGINCGADCTEDYNTGTVVTLTPTLAGDSVFAGWSGDADCSDGQVTMDADKTCTATFGYPVGGIVVPVNKLGLVAPWVGLATLAGLAALGVVVVRRRKP